MPNTISPNMGLIVPGVGTEPGPAWANDLNADLGILDQHNHSSGQGVPITPSGLNINADLNIQSNNLVSVKTINFNSQASALPGTPPNLGCIYVAGNELVYNDEAGNVVAITLNGSVNAGAGSITGLPSGTASASYSSGTQTFVWQSATSTPANMDFGSAIFRNIVPNSKGLTLNPPNAMSADYSVTLPPSNPIGALAFLTMDTSNNIAATYSTVDGSVIPTSGIITMFGGASAPSGYLLCDGQSYLIATYPNLAAALFDSGTGNYAYGSADPTHFNVPDLRGLFPRGVNNGSGNDPDASSRTAQASGGNTGDNIGSVQPDDFNSHSHGPQSPVPNFVGIGFNGGLGSVAGANVTPMSTTGNTGGNETRPKNVYVNFIIKI